MYSISEVMIFCAISFILGIGTTIAIKQIINECKSDDYEWQGALYIKPVDLTYQDLLDVYKDPESIDKTIDEIVDRLLEKMQ